MKVKFLNTGAVHEVYKLGVFTPHPAEVKTISSGEVGYLSGFD